MNKSILKNVLLASAVGGLVFLGFRAHKYIRMFLALRNSDSNEISEEQEAARDQEIDELLKSGDAVKVRISPVSEDEE